MAGEKDALSGDERGKEEEEARLLLTAFGSFASAILVLGRRLEGAEEGSRSNGSVDGC